MSFISEYGISVAMAKSWPSLLCSKRSLTGSAVLKAGEEIVLQICCCIRLSPVEVGGFGPGWAGAAKT
eukprot:15350245-Ditylum_brightwellii.AAC.1